MKKIYLDLPEHICTAIAFNLVGSAYELVGDAALSDLQVSKLDIAEGKVRVGEVIDKIARDFGSSFELGGVEFNLKSQSASRGGSIVKLTEKEVGLIAKLHSTQDFVARAEVLQEVWGYSEGTDTRTVESHVHRLNQKFEDKFGFKLVEHKDGLYRLAQL